MKLPYLSGRSGGSVLLLALLACTEKKDGFQPAPAPPTPVAPVVNEQPRDFNQYTTLVWSDEFNDSTLDQSKWTYEQGGGGWGNNELQSYTTSPGNVFVSGGFLTIRARREQAGANGYTSGRLITKGKQSIRYGRVDVRAKVPKGKGVWPAIWMLGADIDQVGWPACGEIDIMELRGSRPKELLSTLHFGNSPADHRYKTITKVLPEELSADFHVFTVVRSKDLLRFFLDGELYHTFTGADANPFPFNNPFFVVLNVAVGGDFDGDPDASTVFPQQMQVDYVRHYEYR